jgi:hypothetical protein
MTLWCLDFSQAKYMYIFLFHFIYFKPNLSSSTHDNRYNTQFYYLHEGGIPLRCYSIMYDFYIISL